MTLLPTDADLVAALLGGDRAALGHVYDRYGDSLYDTAAAMLRDRDEAADVVQEVFLVAARKLDQLRDPDRLKPWLFAVLRNEVFRRTKRRRRTVSVDFGGPADVQGGWPEMAAPVDPRAEAGQAEHEELAELVRAAASGLDERDQLVMELSLRQELSGDDLAAAVGVSTAQAHVLVHRMRGRLAKSLGAVTVARMGRDDCPDLADILQGWDGSFSVLLRKRVARHVERCETCEETRDKYPVGSLFASAPVLAAPADLREAVLAATRAGGRTARDHRFDDAGFPRPARAMRPASAGWQVGLAAVVVLVVLGMMVGPALLDGGDTTGLAAGAPSTDAPTTTENTSTSEPSTTGAIDESNPTTTSTTATSTTSTSIAASPATEVTNPLHPDAGSIVVSSSVVDLGHAAPSGAVVLSNSGGQPADWTLTRNTASPFVWSAVAGSLDPGETVTLAVSVDRSSLGERTYTGTFTIEGAGKASSVEVRARVERDPQITDVRGPSSISCSSPSGVVVATVTDESDLDSVVLRWSGPGESGQRPMVEHGIDDWEGFLEPEPVGGEWTFTVAATDRRGNTATVSRPFVVAGC